MKTCFSEEQLREPPISTKPPISEQFFMTPLFVQLLKIRPSP